MNLTEILEKLTGGSTAAGGRLANGDVSSLMFFVARLVVACAGFAAALLIEAIPPAWVTVILIACALIAGFDVIAAAVLGVLRRDYINRDLLTLAAAVLAFIFSAQIEGCALLLLYQITSIFIDYAVERTRRSVLATVYCDAAKANLIGENGRESTVDASKLQPGNIIVIRAGETVPCDCIVLKGSSRVDCAPLGDETGVTEVRAGDELFSGSANLSGELRCEVSAAREDSAASRLYSTVESAPRKGEALPEALIGVKKYFAPAVSAVAVLLAVVLPIITDMSFAESIRRATMLLIIASPLSMFAAIPVIRLCACCGAARAGILYDSCSAMDAMSGAGCVAFSQSGTLTEGSPKVVEVRGGRMGGDVLLKIAAHALSSSSSPISRCIAEAYGGQISLDLIENFSEAPGYGVEVVVDGIPIRVGNRALMNIGRVTIPDDDLFSEDGDQIVYVAITDEYAGCIILRDSLREDAVSGIEDLRSCGVDSIVMFSADSRDHAARLAGKLGITEYYSECSRDKQRSSLSSLKQSLAPGRSLVFVGSGDELGGAHTAADADAALAGVEALSVPNNCDVIAFGGKVGKLAQAVGIARYARMLSLATAGGAAVVKLILMIIAALGVSTLWFTVFIDAIAAVAAALVSILAFSGELYGSSKPAKK